MAAVNKNITTLAKPASMTDAQWISYLSTAQAADHVTNGYLSSAAVFCCDPAIQGCQDHDADAISARVLKAAILAGGVPPTAVQMAQQLQLMVKLQAKGLAFGN